MGTLVNVTRRWRRFCVALSLSHSLVMIRPWDWEEMTWHLRKAIIIIYHSTNPLFPHRRSWDIFRCDAIQRHPALITLYFATKPHRWYWFCWFHASIPQLNPIVADAIISLWFKSIGVAKPQINALAKLVRRAICCVSRTPNRGPKHMSMRATIDAKQIRSRQRWFVVCHQCVNTRQSPSRIITSQKQQQQRDANAIRNANWNINMNAHSGVVCYRSMSDRQRQQRCHWYEQKKMLFIK